MKYSKGMDLRAFEVGFSGRWQQEFSRKTTDFFECYFDALL